LSVVPRHGDDEGRLVLRGNVKKSLLKATIAIAVFSLFLEISPNNLIDYFTFLAIFYALAGAYIVFKHGTKYVLDDAGITISPLMRAQRLVEYHDIAELSYSQGMLARRFHCGTVFMLLKSGKGRVRVMGGGSGEAMKDVHEPQFIIEEISSRLSPFHDVRSQI
jgi:hypothetical protein